MRAQVCGAMLVLMFMVGSAGAQATAKRLEGYGQKNMWTVFGEYSNTSSHILMGDARNRMFGDLGVGYTRQVFDFGGSRLGYQVELRPVVLESDPTAHNVSTSTVTGGPYAGTVTSSMTDGVPIRCVAGTLSGTIPADPPYFDGFSYTSVTTCGRRWTFGQAFSPVGFKYSMWTRHPIQPFVIGTLGYLYTTKAVPLKNAGSFNFVFDFGLGVEVYRSKTRSISLEARYHHFSNKNSAPENPGTDNLMYKVSYGFGR